MAGNVDGAAGRIVVEILRAERNALVQCDVAADNGGLADDDSRTVVDGEMTADRGSGMDVDARDAMGVFREHPGDDARPEAQQHVRRPVIQHRRDGRIAEHDFADAGGCRVILRDRLHVRLNQPPDLRQFLDECLRKGKARHGAQFRQDGGSGVFGPHVAVIGEHVILDTGHHRLEMPDGLVQCHTG